VQDVQQAGEFRPIGPGAGHLFRKNPGASGSVERVLLQSQILLAGRDAGIAVDSHPKPNYESANYVSANYESANYKSLATAEIGIKTNPPQLHSFERSGSVVSRAVETTPPSANCCAVPSIAVAF